MKTNRLGERHLTNEGYWLTVTDYKTYTDCTVKFDDGGIWDKICYSAIKSGRVKNPNKITVCGMGYLGRRIEIKKSSFELYIHSRWSAMLRRCYDAKTIEKQPTYKDVTVCNEWLCYDNFRTWFIKNYVDGWQLDKDILSTDVKVYSPEVCVFVPKEINTLFNIRRSNRGKFPLGVNFEPRNKKYTADINIYGKPHYLGIYDSKEDAFNAYRIAKKKHVLSTAEKWKDKLDYRVYDAMVKFDININD